MTTPADAHADLTRFFAARFDTLAAQLRAPLDRGDSCFVVEALPTWLGPDLTLRLDLLPSGDPDAEPPRFALTMVVDFGRYHRSMQLIAGPLDTHRAFAADVSKDGQLASAILELMKMERSAP
ncbi:MAG: hypothetical protein U0325_30190 [Polyangiales bacterium]